MDFFEEEIAGLDEEVERRMGPFQKALEQVDSVTGVGRRGAEEILVETGKEMERFPTDAHIASWAKLCPGNNESAGKRKSGSIGGGNPWLRSALIEAAWAAVRTRTYLSAQFHRLAARIGAKRAIVAVAHSILVIIYHVLKDGVPYQDLGHDYFQHRNPERVRHRAIRQLESLGYNVTLDLKPA